MFVISVRFQGTLLAVRLSEVLSMLDLLSTKLCVLFILGSIEQNAEKDVMDLPSVMQQSSELNVEGSRVTQPSGGVEESTLSQRQKSSKTVQSSFKTIVSVVQSIDAYPWRIL